MNEPEPVDESKPAPEIRGGDRPADYIPDTNKWASIHVGEDEDSDDENEYKDGGDC
jgi:hypothetical protein